jgi:hypothetical protein
VSSVTMSTRSAAALMRSVANADVLRAAPPMHLGSQEAVLEQCNSFVVSFVHTLPYLSTGHTAPLWEKVSQEERRERERGGGSAEADTA